ncbi:hypothetical protein SAMN05877831_106114 [Rhodobacter maris]|uniref:Uncharacterized protein n=1 Tax=Rhodobacter maris TaxID=446682 RepID=A0A285SJ99_9RHOB|nr:hypothetical protein SAMN05877831_106114 [Rhodobacter maris]
MSRENFSKAEPGGAMTHRAEANGAPDSGEGRCAGGESAALPAGPLPSESMAPAILEKVRQNRSEFLRWRVNLGRISVCREMCSGFVPR